MPGAEPEPPTLCPWVTHIEGKATSMGNCLQHITAAAAAAAVGSMHTRWAGGIHISQNYAGLNAAQHQKEQSFCGLSRL